MQGASESIIQLEGGPGGYYQEINNLYVIAS